MRTKILFCCFFIFSVSVLFSQNNQKVYSLINEWKIDDAYNEVEKQLKSNPDLENYLLKFFIMEFQGRVTDKFSLGDVITKSSNPNPYLYALWYEEPLIGYGFPKKESQLKLLKSIASNESSFNINLYSSANYALSLNSFFLKKERKQSSMYYKKVGVLANWQFVGPFYNLLETENNKILEPLTNPKPDKDFDTEYYGTVHWFSPKYFFYDGWISMFYYLPMKEDNIGYAQTFVFAPEDKDVYLTLGYSGTVKLWLNDALVFEDNEEKMTDYDAYVFKCRLTKGYNRILIQEGTESIDYPYFAIRLLDENFKIINYKTSAEYQPYISTKNIQFTTVPHFAEDFFNKKIESDPNNMLNYVLLSRVYIRKKDSYNAMKIVDEAIKKFGENPLLVYSKTIIYSKDDNKVLKNEMIEKVKAHEETNTYLIYDLNLYDLYAQEKYNEALEVLESKYKNLSIPFDEDYYSNKIEILLKQEKIKEALSLVDEAYIKFPYSIDIVSYKHNIETKLNKNLKKAISYLEKYDNYLYNYKIRSQLVEDYFNDNEKSKAMNLLYDNFNWNKLDNNCYSNLLAVLYQAGEYEKSLQMVNDIIESQPFLATHYQDKGLILMSLKKNKEAIESFNKALSYNCNLFNVRNYLYDLKQEKKIENYVPEIDEKKDVKKYLKQINANYDYFYVMDDRIDVFYPEGGSEQIQKSAIKILSKNGIDRFKKTSVDFNENTQVLDIEDAFLYKSDGRKLKGEINQNEIIWPDLKEQDVIYIKYRIKNYFIGKFSKNFHQGYSFSSFTPDKFQRYVIIAPKLKPVYYKYTGNEAEKYINFKKDSLNEFYIYNWQVDSCDLLGNENYMPRRKDIGKILYVTTLNSWKEIADWYNELIDSKISYDYEVTEVYNSLFNKEEKLGSIEKAKRIYNYITQNINYINGTVFQHRVVPQKSSATIRRKLGDCKDLTVLFVSLANLAGLKSNVVLVNTRDKGNIIPPLPSFNFDHAMVKFYDENNTEYFCELTSPYIPFGYLPADNFQAVTLTIPNKKFPYENDSPELMNPATKKTNKILSKTKISIQEADMKIHYHITWFGSSTEYPKSNFSNLSEELLRSKVVSYIEKHLSVNFPIKLEDFNFSSLEKTLDSVSLDVNFTLNNQVKRLGNSSVFTIPFMETIYNSNIIKEENRKYDIDYYRYEELDEYNNMVEIEISNSKKWTDLPADLVCKFNNSTYSITYKKLLNNKLEVNRKVVVDRTNIKPDKYSEFKTYVTKILEKESSFISFQ